MTTPMPLNATTTTSDQSTPFFVGSSDPAFVDRRRLSADHRNGERRQFGNSHRDLSDDGREIALAIDQYKIDNHRRYLTCDEMLDVLHQLGYTKSSSQHPTTSAG